MKVHVIILDTLQYKEYVEESIIHANTCLINKQNRMAAAHKALRKSLIVMNNNYFFYDSDVEKVIVIYRMWYMV